MKHTIRPAITRARVFAAAALVVTLYGGAASRPAWAAEGRPDLASVILADPPNGFVPADPPSPNGMLSGADFADATGMPVAADADQFYVATWRRPQPELAVAIEFAVRFHSPALAAGAADEALREAHERGATPIEGISGKGTALEVPAPSAPGGVLESVVITRSSMLFVISVASADHGDAQELLHLLNDEQEAQLARKNELGRAERSAYGLGRIVGMLVMTTTGVTIAVVLIRRRHARSRATRYAPRADS